MASAPTQITLDVEKIDGLFLKQEVGSGKIGDDELTFGICLPAGVPYIHLRGAYYNVPDVFQKLIRAVHGQAGCEEQAPSDEHVAQPASTPERVAKVVQARNAKD